MNTVKIFNIIWRNKLSSVKHLYVHLNDESDSDRDTLHDCISNTLDQSIIDEIESYEYKYVSAE